MIIVILLLLSLSAAIGTQILHDFHDLPYDEHGYLSNNLLLYSSTCRLSIVDSILNQDGNMRHTLPASLEIMQHFHNTSSCVFACLQQGVPMDLVQYTLPYLILDGEDFRSSVSSWVQSTCDVAELGVVNNLPHDIYIYWINPDGGDRVEVGIAQIGGEQSMHWSLGHLGHSFLFVDTVTGEEIEEIVLEYDMFLHLGENSPSEGDEEFIAHTEEITSVVLHEEWLLRERVTRTFTEMGFAKGRLPRDIWASMAAFYNNNRDSKTIEDFSNDVLVNWWQSESYLITMPPQLKKYWQGRLKPLVEAWTGIPLELTDIYGVRQYEEGARLLMHVDRINTHAASMIINVHQENVRTPWPVQIYDFADRLHEVIMEPGDILYYESARCLHGRMTPLHGGAYVNIFSHYRPMMDGEGDPQWYERPNPSGTPKATSWSSAICSGQHGDSAVFCQSDRESASFAVATSGDDLMSLWRHSTMR